MRPEIPLQMVGIIFLVNRLLLNCMSNNIKTVFCKLAWVKLAWVCLVAVFVIASHGNSFADSPCDTPDAVVQEANVLAQKFYAAVSYRGSYQTSKALAEKIHSLGIESEDRLLESRGLIRLAFCEIRFGKWGNSWREKLAECEQICYDKSTRAYAELLMFRGYMGKWRPKKLAAGVFDVKAAIVIASQIQDDMLLAEARHCLADLSLIEGHITEARSEALKALTIAEHHGQEVITAKALYTLVGAFEQEHQSDLALSYAKRLLEIDSENYLANAVVSRVTDPQGFIDKQKQDLAKLQKSGITMIQHSRVANVHEQLGKCLLAQGGASDASESFRKAAQHFKLSGNHTNYVDSIIRAYKCCLDNDVPLGDVEPFVEMLETSRFDYVPSNVVDIVSVLREIDQPDLTAKWRGKLRKLRQETLLFEHERATAAAKQGFELELARRGLVEQVEAEQARTRVEQAKALKQKEADRTFRITLVSLFGICCFSLLAFFSMVNRMAYSKLKREVKVREAAQAKSEELAQQLLQTQKLDVLGTLSAGIAHDFNNTLQAISMLTETVKDSVGTESPSHKHLETILEVTEQGSSLTRGMLVFSGKHETNKISGDLLTLVRETEAMVKHLMPTSIVFSARVKTSLPEILVEMNAAQIKQVLLNLVSNAKDAMPDGGELTIEVSEPAEKPDFVQLTVSDNGKGMSDEVRSRIFEPFFTTKDRGRGTGLGMSMAHGIAEDHGGTIEVQSEVGVGTTIKILLPRVLDEQINSLTPAIASDRGDAGGRLVLLTDDNEYIRLGIRATLEQLGYQVEEAQDGLAALDVYAGMTKKPDLILMDVDLPRLAGPACVDALREKGATAPVIFITGLSSSELNAPVLYKPFTQEDLVKAIREVQQNPNQQDVEKGAGSGS